MQVLKGALGGTDGLGRMAKPNVRSNFIAIQS
jgi:hypothetical protein